MKTTIMTALVACAFSALNIVGAAQAESIFMGLGDLPGGGYETLASGISADGSVVTGRASSDLGKEAYRWTAATGMVGLGIFDDGSSQGFGISADGSVIVGTQTSVTLPNAEAFRWEGGVFTPLGFLPSPMASHSRASATSADGSVVVGSSNSIEGSNEAFRWEGGVMTGLGDLPGGSFDSTATGVSSDGSVVAGWGRSATDIEAFRWTQADGMVGLGALPGGILSRGDAISADGSTIVGQASSSLGDQAFRWTQADGMVGLGDLPGGIVDSFAHAVSSDGTVIVGLGVGQPGSSGAFIWDLINGMRSIQNILLADGLSVGWELGKATGISADGLTIIGAGINPDGQVEAWIASLRPDPPVNDSVTDAGDPAIELTSVEVRRDQELFVCVLNVASGSGGLVKKSAFICNIDFHDNELERTARCRANDDRDFNDLYKLGNNGVCPTADISLTYEIKTRGGGCEGLPSIVCAEEEVDAEGDIDEMCDGDVSGDDAVSCSISVTASLDDIADFRDEECDDVSLECLTTKDGATGNYDVLVFFESSLKKNLDQVPDTDDKNVPNEIRETKVITLTDPTL